MKRTLVLVVDRDDDFGVKGKVNTPVIGVQNCLDAANAFGIADPEDSDLNALYCAISTCLEIQDEGIDADVALICGDENVGHIADLALVQQLETVLDIVRPDSLVLVGDGAEDEYIYPIISSRIHVDSVRKVYVKQAPGIEGAFYIVKKMLNDPDKRRRFVVPFGFLLMLLATIFLVPTIAMFLLEGDSSQLANISGPLAVIIIGLAFVFYGYDAFYRISNFRHALMEKITNRSTPIIFLAISVAFVLIVGVLSYLEIKDMYMRSDILKLVYLVSIMVWPVIIAFIVYEGGLTIDAFMRKRIMNISLLFNCISLASLGLVATGILDIVLLNMGFATSTNLAILEIASGVALSFFGSYLKGRMGFSGEDQPEIR